MGTGIWIEVRRRKDVGTSVPILPYEVIVTGATNDKSLCTDLTEVIKCLGELGVPANEAAKARDWRGHGEASPLYFKVPE